MEAVISTMREISEICDANGLLDTWPRRYGVRDGLYSGTLRDALPVINLGIHRNIFDVADTKGQRLTIVKRLKKNTTQGRIYVAELCGTSLNEPQPICVKITRVPLSDSKNDTWERGRYVTGKHPLPYLVVPCARMDAGCAEALSHLVLSHTTPHFPIVYRTFMAEPRYGERTRNFMRDRECIVVILMQYIPYSFARALRPELPIERWWPALFQIAAGAAVAYQALGLVHNDLHADNIRAAPCDFTHIHYVSLDGVRLAVPTHGNLFSIIDFGRAAVARQTGDRTTYRPHAGNVSSEFYGRGKCRTLVPDNIFADFVRLLISLEDILRLHPVSPERSRLLHFFKEACTTSTHHAPGSHHTNSYDMLSILRAAESSGSREAVYDAIERGPKLYGDRAAPNWVLKRLAKDFISSRHLCTGTCQCYILPLYLRA